MLASSAQTARGRPRAYCRGCCEPQPVEKQRRRTFSWRHLRRFRLFPGLGQVPHPFALSRARRRHAPLLPCRRRHLRWRPAPRARARCSRRSRHRRSPRQSRCFCPSSCASPPASFGSACSRRASRVACCRSAASRCVTARRGKVGRAPRVCSLAPHRCEFANQWCRACAACGARARAARLHAAAARAHADGACCTPRCAERRLARSGRGPGSARPFAVRLGCATFARQRRGTAPRGWP
jgi:hypothetical protein